MREEPTKAPSVAEETERLRKWREIRRLAAEAPVNKRLEQATQDRETRLDLFEKDKARRIREAEARRRTEAEGIETRRMEKARAHLDALDDIETAKAHLLAARHAARKMTAIALGVCVGLPTLLTALYFMFIAQPVFQSTSIFALQTTQPIAPRNPLFNDSDPYLQSSMALAFQLRARLNAATPEPRPFSLSIDTQQGLLTLITSGADAASAVALNQQILAGLPLPLMLIAPASIPMHALSRAPKNTLLVFLSSLSIFAIAAVFLQALRHHAHT
ncbi:MAG: hypothetical protein V3V13_05975 [Paracoccaceae bacterium]